MKQASKPATCIVVGAGIAGLLAARRLQDSGVEVTVLDKGAGVGGRMATRRIDGAVFDHGAQFFTARDAHFTELTGNWLAEDVGRNWCSGFLDSDGATHPDGHPRYCGTEGMTSIPKHLAKALDVRLHTKVFSAETSDRRWQVNTDGGPIHADALLLTAPVPQSIAILDAGGYPWTSSDRDALEAISYDPCTAALAQLDGPSGIPSPGAVQLGSEPISWIADNQQKGISPLAPCVTIHAGPEFSRAHEADDDAVVANLLLAGASRWILSRAMSVQIHRWRYAKPVHLHPERCLYTASGAPLAFAGDAFGAPRVEGAALSGLAAADALLRDERSPEFSQTFWRNK